MNTTWSFFFSYLFYTIFKCQMFMFNITFFFSAPRYKDNNRRNRGQVSSVQRYTGFHVKINGLYPWAAMSAYMSRYVYFVLSLWLNCLIGCYSNSSIYGRLLFPLAKSITKLEFSCRLKKSFTWWIMDKNCSYGANHCSNKAIGPINFSV